MIKCFYENLYIICNVRNVNVIPLRVYILVFSLRRTQVDLCSYYSVYLLPSFEKSRFPVKLVYYFARNSFNAYYQETEKSKKIYST